VADGTINLTASGIVNVAGVEVWRGAGGPPASPTATPVTTSMPTNTPTNTAMPGGGSATFYRGVNLNGPALTIDGNAWAASASAPNFTSNGTAMSNAWLTLQPSASGSLATMLRTWRQHWALSVALSQAPSDTYQVYVYVVQDWNDPNPPTVTFRLEGQTVGTYVAGGTGEWRRLGPYTATVADGTINLTASGIVNVAGVEVWRGAGTPPSPTPSATPTP
jgi:hypothetical protein